MGKHILVIDDEESLCEILSYNLRREGYEVDCAYSAEEALTLDLGAYDLFIVDVMMEKLSGFDFAKRVRGTEGIEQTPLIFCTALTGEDDSVMGLNIGGDDYVTKPFVISEVIARVRAVLRRSAPRVAAPRPAPAADARGAAHKPLPPVSHEGLVVNQDAKTVTVDGAPVALTKTEYKLLLYLLTHPNRVFSREELIELLWAGEVVTRRSIDTNITRLRHKIGPYGPCIVTRLGFGYGFRTSQE